VLVHTRTGEQRVPRLSRVRCSHFGACWIRPYCVGRFGTFLFDSERQRAMHNVHTATESIWDQVWRWGAHGLARRRIGLLSGTDADQCHWSSHTARTALGRLAVR
jgi:hypothetical protein